MWTLCLALLVLVAGTVSRREICLQVLGRLRGRYPDLRMALVGSNDFVESVQKPMARRLELDDNARFVGAPTAAKISGWYRNAAGLLFP